ncbi:MAG: DNA topoisomerase (ATP-hydrolyzing) subunit B [Lentisphaeria bacterium]|nr:DNA topoisomerase (ATP-hydrolyzing) subunit B [Lentisphaeria bacterium]
MSEENIENIKNAEEYSASKITVLEGLEAVRVRPSMYIGDTGVRGLHHLVYEVVDNSIDEALAGYASDVKVTIRPDNSITVEDDGRGIPVDMHPTENKPAVEVVLTVLHAGGKFDHNSYKVSGGLHGVGVSCVNALSDWMDVEVCREGKAYAISFKRGVTAKPLTEIGTTSKRGTKVSFKPDGTIFPDTVYVWDTLAKRLRELAFLNRGIHITLTDERDITDGAPKSEHFHYEGGITEFVTILNTDREVINPEVIYFHRERAGIDVEVAMQYTAHNTVENIHTYTNNINTIEGGTHLVGFQAALTRTINNYIREKVKNPPTLSGKDVREGLAAVISVKVPDPQFEGQTKTKLGNSEVRGIVESVINDEFSTYLEENPNIAKQITENAMLAFQANEAARRARESIRKTNKVSVGLPGKLADCSCKDPEKRELYIVEGDSAGGSAKGGRDNKIQAILPIRGKLLNVEKVRQDRMFANKEIQSLFYAIGCGVGDEFDITKARYHRVVIMTDADVDGSHIRTLLLTFFFRQMRPLIEAGYVYIAKPPLYKVTKGKKSSYIDTEEQLNRYLVELGLDEMIVTGSADDRQLSVDEVRNLIALYNRAAHSSVGLQRCGIEPEEYFSMVREDGLCPIAHITVREHNGTSTAKYVYSTDEQYAFITEAEARLRGDKAETEDSEISSRIDVVNIFEARNCETLAGDLKAAGLSMKQVYSEGDTIYNVSPSGNSGNVQPVRCLKELFSFIRNSGQTGSGLRINRYKGLGEMNASQLWETTMDPNTRTMIKVTMEDAIEADRIFNLLMGDVVEPRREYIEKHAAHVKDLDI